MAYRHRALIRSPHQALAALCAVGLLSACALLPPIQQVDVASTEDDQTVSHVTLLGPLPIPRPKPEPPSDQIAAIPSDLASVVGYDRAEVRDLLGEPIWVEEIPPALSWQYASEECVLRVFFFMEVTTRNFRVLSYDVTSNDDANDVDQRCLSDLVAQASERRS